MTLNKFFQEDEMSVNKTENNVFEKTINSLIYERNEELENLKKLADFKPIWTTAEPFATVRIGSKSIGVYRIIYRPTGETKSIGEGNISQRRSRHKGCFLNGGEDMVSANGHVSPSQTAKKMYNYDPNINNWLFSFCVVNVKAVSTAYETELIKDEEPEFNLLSMAGK